MSFLYPYQISISRVAETFSASEGAASLTRFAGLGGVQPSAAIDADTATLLAPYRARIFV